MVDLMQFFARDYDVANLRAKVLEEEGIDIQGVYCLATGAMIGTFDESEIEYAIDEIGEDVEEESLVDDLLVRVVASMRPAPSMNKPDKTTLTQMVARRPVDAFAYLANRLNGNKWLVTQRDGQTSFAPLLGRILTHRMWTHLHTSGVDLKPWIHWLLELDSKMNLHEMSPPCVSLGKSNEWILDRTGTPLLQMVTPENAEQMLKAFESWVFKQLEFFDARDRQVIAQAAWMRGNTHTRDAYARSWLENPEVANRKRADELAKKAKKTTPGRPKSERTRKLDERVSKFLGLLDEILDGGSDNETPAPIAPRKGRLIMGGNLIFKKKES